MIGLILFALGVLGIMVLILYTKSPPPDDETF